MNGVRKALFVFIAIAITVIALWFTNRSVTPKEATREDVQKEAKQDFIMIKVDLTLKGNPVHEHLLKEYEVKGVPTVVFLNRKGNEIDDLRLVDFLPASQFLIRMAEAKKLL